jgi:UDP-2,3-diacylglucosamine hydrolase
MTTLIVSDLHLHPSQPEITAQFRDFLATIARDADALYVLGDLFEAWLGDDDECPHNAAVSAAFAELSASGVALYFMHGNRDFLLGPAFCARTGGTLLTDPTVLEVDGRRLLLTHGDALCTDDVPYQKLRALVRNPRLQRSFLRLSLATRSALAGEARQGSQDHTAKQAMALMDVNQRAVEDTFRRAGVDLIVHGHTHRPAVHTLAVDGRERTRIVLGDWHRQGSYLRLSALQTELVSLPRA